MLGQHAAFSAEFLITNDIGFPAEQKVLLELLNSAEAVRRETGLPSVAALYLNENSSRQLTGLGGYEPAMTCGVDCEVPVAWNSWDDYLGHLGKGPQLVMIKYIV